MTEFHIWENGVGCGAWEASDPVSALALAIGGACWDTTEPTTYTLKASDLDDDEPRTAAATVHVDATGRPIRVVIGAD